MTSAEQQAFRSYLESVTDELLDSVSADCAWLSERLAGERVGPGYLWRLDACRHEYIRRKREYPSGLRRIS